MSECLKELNGSLLDLLFVLTIDSHGLYSTVTTLHEGADYRLRPTVARMRDSFESGEISVMQWIPGKMNLSDALTKRNIEMYRTLNIFMVEGIINQSIFDQAQRVTMDS